MAGPSVRRSEIGNRETVTAVRSRIPWLGVMGPVKGATRANWFPGKE